MDIFHLLMLVLGLALILCLLYLAFTGQPIPPAFRMVVLVAVALILVLCLANLTGCHSIPIPVVR